LSGPDGSSSAVRRRFSGARSTSSTAQRTVSCRAVSEAQWQLSQGALWQRLQSQFSGAWFSSSSSSNVRVQGGWLLGPGGCRPCPRRCRCSTARLFPTWRWVCQPTVCQTIQGSQVQAQAAGDGSSTRQRLTLARRLAGRHQPRRRPATWFNGRTPRCRNNAPPTAAGAMTPTVDQLVLAVLAVPCHAHAHETTSAPTSASRTQSLGRQYLSPSRWGPGKVINQYLFDRSGCRPPLVSCR